MASPATTEAGGFTACCVLCGCPESDHRPLRGVANAWWRHRLSLFIARRLVWWTRPVEDALEDM